MNKRVKTGLIVVICIIAVFIVIQLTMHNLVPVIKSHVTRMHGIR